MYCSTCNACITHYASIIRQDEASHFEGSIAAYNRISPIIINRLNEKAVSRQSQQQLVQVKLQLFMPWAHNFSFFSSQPPSAIDRPTDRV